MQSENDNAIPLDCEALCRCLRCGALLAVQRGARIHVRYKGMQVSGKAPLCVSCRKCGVIQNVGVNAA